MLGLCGAMFKSARALANDRSFFEMVGIDGT